MRNKYKITGFARLLIFMLFFAPIAYIGASYYQGEDGIAKIKSIFNSNNNDTTSNDDTIELRISKKKQEIFDLENKLNASKKDPQRLEKETR